MWESGEGYVYARTADDDMQDAELRDPRVETKCRKRMRDFRKLVPGAVDFEAAFAPGGNGSEGGGGEDVAIRIVVVPARGWRSVRGAIESGGSAGCEMGSGAVRRCANCCAD